MIANPQNKPGTLKVLLGAISVMAHAFQSPPPSQMIVNSPTPTTQPSPVASSDPVARDIALFQAGAQAVQQNTVPGTPINTYAGEAQSLAYLATIVYALFKSHQTAQVVATSNAAPAKTA